MIKVLIFILIMVAVISFFWHDNISTWLATWQTQAVNQGPDLIKQGSQKAQNWFEQNAQRTTDQFVSLLTAQGKQKIDQWLKDNKLNQYGDPVTTSYASGTPLLDQATGKSIDRYVYLLKKFPDIVDELNLTQYLNKK